jgi:hypothetical protein
MFMSVAAIAIALQGAPAFARRLVVLAAEARRFPVWFLIVHRLLGAGRNSGWSGSIFRVRGV